MTEARAYQQLQRREHIEGVGLGLGSNVGFGVGFEIGHSENNEFTHALSMHRGCLCVRPFGTEAFVLGFVSPLVLFLILGCVWFLLFCKSPFAAI